jgi:hypothetical protein
MYWVRQYVSMLVRHVPTFPRSYVPNWSRDVMWLGYPLSYGSTGSSASRTSTTSLLVSLPSSSTTADIRSVTLAPLPSIAISFIT